MRIEVKRQPLARAVALAAKVAGNRQADHASGLLLLESWGVGLVTVSATNLDESVRLIVRDARIGLDNATGIALDAGRLSALLAAETAEDLLLTVKGKQLVVEGSCRAEFKVLPADAIPALPLIGEGAVLATLPREALSFALQRASLFLGRPGTHTPTFFALEAEDGALVVYAANGYGMYREGLGAAIPEGWEVLAEGRLLDYVKAAEGEEVELGESGGFVALRGQGVEAFFRRLESKFNPRGWGKMIAEQQNGAGVALGSIEAGDLREAVAALAGMADKGALLTLDERGVHLAGESYAVDQEVATGVRSFATKELGVIKSALLALDGELRIWETEKVLVLADGNSRTAMLSRWGG